METPKRKKTALIKAVEVVNEMLITPETNPRLHKSEIIDVNSDNLDSVLDDVTESLKEDPAKPVLIVGIKKLDNLVNQFPLFTRIIKYPNVRVVSVANYVNESLQTFDKPRASLEADKEQQALDKIRGIIRHDLRHALNGSTVCNKETLVKKARTRLGLTGNDEEIIKQVMNEDKKIEVEEQVNIRALCIDWDDTLMKKEGFDHALLKRAQQQSEREAAPLIIWTGGDVDAVYKKLAELGFKNDINVCSKHDCAGLKMTFAIDDQNLAQLKNEFGLDVEFLEQI